MAVESPPWALTAGSYTAEQTRRAAFMWAARTGTNSPGIVAGGLVSTADLQLSAPASGMSVNVSAGEALVGGSEGGAQGAAYCRATSQTNLAVSASNATNPRIDTVCATVSDAGYTEPTGGSGSQWALQVVTGTPTSGATLANLSGAATLPLSSLLLGYVLVPATSTNVTAGNLSNVATATLGQSRTSLAAYGGGGAVNIATSQSVTSTTYTTLATPDQVTGVVVPTNGLLMVGYRATWQESVANAGRAAIFIGANQLKIAPASTTVGTAPAIQEASTGSAGTVNQDTALAAGSGGLTSEAIAGAGAYTGDVATGQILGVNGSMGFCVVQVAAGTYTVSVQFKSSSGSVTAKNRTLWVEAIPFS